MERKIILSQVEAFRQHLYEDEKSKATVDKYIRDIRKFMEYAGAKEMEKSLTMSYKEMLAQNYTINSANSMLAAMNTFLRFLGWQDCCVKQFKVQRKTYCSEEKELTQAEYQRLVRTAHSKGNERLNLLIQTICATGIRVSELEHITIEALEKGEAVVSCKGKVRTVFIVAALRKKLKKFARQQGIKTGPIFVTKTGNPMDRSNIWKEMKGLCEQANVSPDKVFPHNLRHLFARTYYNLEKDIAKLADILGHTSINTTRIYVMTTGVEHKEKMEKLRLVI